MDVALNITRRCNKGCSYCYLRLEDTDLPLEQIQAILGSLTDVETVTLTGGEPLMHPEFSEVLSSVSNREHHIHLLTNGILLEGRTLERIADSEAELFVTYNGHNKRIQVNITRAYEQGLDVNVHHVLTQKSVSALDRVCDDVGFAKSILLLYPTNVGNDSVMMYEPETWFDLLDRATGITKKHGIKTYFEQAFARKGSALAINQPCPTGEDIFIDVNGRSYPCCLLVDLVGGRDNIGPIPYTAQRCEILRKNQLSSDSDYIRICPIAITDRYDGEFQFPSHLEEL